MLLVTEVKIIPAGGLRMRNTLALGLVLLSGMLLLNSGLEVYHCFVPKKISESQPIRLVRIEGKNCPLYYPEGQ